MEVGKFNDVLRAYIALHSGVDIDLSQNKPKKSKEWTTIATTHAEIFGNEGWEHKSHWRFPKNQLVQQRKDSNKRMIQREK